MEQIEACKRACEADLAHPVEVDEGEGGMDEGGEEDGAKEGQHHRGEERCVRVQPFHQQTTTCKCNGKSKTSNKNILFYFSFSFASSFSSAVNSRGLLHATPIPTGFPNGET